MVKDIETHLAPQDRAMFLVALGHISWLWV